MVFIGNDGDDQAVLLKFSNPLDYTEGYIDFRTVLQVYGA